MRLLIAVPVLMVAAPAVSAGDREVDTDIGCKLSACLNARVDMFNVTNCRGDAADYRCVTYLKGEPAEGIAGVPIPPPEPRSLRFALTATR